MAPLVLLVLLVTAVLVSSEWSYQAARSALSQLDRRAEVRVATQRVLRRLVDAESAQRGYLLTGREAYLAPYRDADADVARDLDSIRRHFEHDPQLNPRFEALSARSTEKLSELSTTLSAYQAGRHEAWQAILSTDIGRERMEAAREAAMALVDGEAQRIVDDRALVDRVLARGRLGVLAATLLTLVGLTVYLRQHDAFQAAQEAHALELHRQRDELERQVRARTQELRALNAHLQDVREVERSKLARLLHDELGALLTAAKLDLARLRRTMGPLPEDASSRLSHLGSAIDAGVALKRRIIEELSPSALPNLGLKAALEILVAEFHHRTHIDVTLDSDEPPLSEAQRIAVYRLVQESLHNIERHAGALSAQVTVRQDGPRLRVQVVDSGIGFDPRQVGAGSHGLRTLRHRLEALGGHLRTDSARGRGTRIDAELPLQQTEAGSAKDDSGPRDAASPG